MRTPESTEMIVRSSIALDSDCSKVRQSPKGYIRRISPKKVRNPDKPFSGVTDSDINTKHGDEKLRRLLGAQGHNVDLNEIEPELKRKIKRAFKMFD